MLKRLLLLALIIPQVGWAGARPGADLAALDATVRPLLSQIPNAGVSIAQVRHGRVTLAAAYGQQNAGVPATPQTLYNLASLTKPLSAEVVLRLVSDGAFQLDEPMSSAWIDPDIVGDPRAATLTPRLALSHRTGFPNWRDRKTGLRFLRAPGEGVGYSGEGYDYVARFAEKRTGQAFEALAKDRLLEPAGLRATSYVGEPWFDGRIALPTTAEGVALRPLIRTHFTAADAVYATAADYAGFLNQVFKDRGLTPAIARERDRVQASTRAEDCAGAKAKACPDEVGFGLGWQVMVFGRRTILMHTGKDEGVFTLAYLDKTTGDGAVILTNSDNGASLVLPILEALRAPADFIAFLRSQAS